MDVPTVICAIVISTGGVVCSEPVGLLHAAAYVALANAQHPFNKGEPIQALTLLLEKDKPTDAGHLELGGLKQ